MSEENWDKAEKKHKGKYNKWMGALQYISVWSRQDISHAVMQLSVYNVAQSLPCWKALVHIMYPRKIVEESKIITHHSKGEGDITELKK